MIKDKFQALIDQLSATEGENLLAVVVYGSSLTAPESARADFQWLVLTRRLDADDLRRIRPVIRGLVSQGYAMPAFFTAAEFKDSLDVVPIEVRQTKRAHEVLYGEDPLASVEASAGNLRLQIEYELRGKLLRLRSLYLPASESAANLLQLMTESVISFVRVMRSMLDLLGETPPLDRLAAARRVGERLKVDVAPVIRLLQLRTERRELMEIETQDLFAAYIDCLSKLIEAVDKLDGAVGRE
ncbi:MAG: hypothetical protein ACK5RS_11650 [Acidobacteriota bacterium]